MSIDTDVQTAFFTITGEGITFRIRDLWESNLVKESLDIIEKGFPDIEKEDALDICIGKKKLCGNSNDSYTIEDDDYFNTTEFTIEWQIKTLENGLLKFVKSLNRSQRNLLNQFGIFDYESAVYRCGSLDFRFHVESQESKDEKILEKSKNKIKNIVDGLEVLYPIFGKNIKDIANIFIEAGKQLSNTEIYRREARFYKIEVNRDRRLRESAQKKLQNKKDKVNKIYEKEINIPEKCGIEFCYNGILDIDGNFYDCMYQDHNGLLEILEICIREGLVDLKNKPHKNIGFIKLQNGGFYPILNFNYEFRWTTKEQEKEILSYFNNKENNEIKYKSHTFETVDDLKYLLDQERNGKESEDIYFEIKSEKNKKLFDREREELEKIKQKNIKDLKEL